MYLKLNVKKSQRSVQSPRTWSFTITAVDAMRPVATFNLRIPNLPKSKTVSFLEFAQLATTMIIACAIVLVRKKITIDAAFWCYFVAVFTLTSFFNKRNDHQNHQWVYSNYTLHNFHHQRRADIYERRQSNPC